MPATELELELHMVAGVQPAALGTDKHVAGAGIVVAHDEAEIPLVIEEFQGAEKYLGQMRLAVLC